MNLFFKIYIFSGLIFFEDFFDEFLRFFLVEFLRVIFIDNFFFEEFFRDFLLS